MKDRKTWSPWSKKQCKHSSCISCLIWFWNNMRVSKWWPNFGVNYSKMIWHASSYNIMLIMLSVLLPQNYIMIKKKPDYLVLVLIHNFDSLIWSVMRVNRCYFSCIIHWCHTATYVIICDLTGQNSSQALKPDSHSIIKRERGGQVSFSMTQKLVRREG